MAHITGTFSFVASLLGGSIASPEWTKGCGGGSKPGCNRSAFPSKEEMITTLTSHLDEALKLLEAAPASLLEAPNANERMRSIFPTTGDMLLFLLNGHIANHAGQLAAWRRARGYAVLF